MSNDRFDLDKLKEAQENFDASEAEKEEKAAKAAAEQEAMAVAEEEILPGRDAELDRTRVLESRRQGLADELELTSLEDAIALKQETEQQIFEITQDHKALANNLETIQREVIVAAKGKLAPEVKAAVDELQKRMAPISSRLENLEKRRQEREARYQQLIGDQAEIERLSAEIKEAEVQLSAMENMPGVKELLHAEALTDNEMYDRYHTEALPALQKYRNKSTGKKRGERQYDSKSGEYNYTIGGEESEAFVRELADDLLNAELEHLGVDKIKNKEERQKRKEDIMRQIAHGIRSAKNDNFLTANSKIWAQSPNVTGETRELRFKGYLLASSVDSADTSAYYIPNAIENSWDKADRNGESLRGRDGRSGKEILDDMLPILNKVKAAAYVDSRTPVSANGKETTPTEILFADKGFQHETYESENDHHFAGGMRRAGYVGVTSPELPIFSNEWLDSPDGVAKFKEATGQYLREMERYQKTVNNVRGQRETARQEKQNEIPAEIEQLQKEMERLDRITLNQVAIVSRFEQERRNLAGATEAIPDLEADWKEAEARLKKQKAGRDQISGLRMLARRKAGKEVDAVAQEEAKKLKPLAAARYTQKAAQEVVDLYRDDYKLIKSGVLYSAIAECKNRILILGSELKAYESSDFSQPVEVVKELRGRVKQTLAVKQKDR